MDWERLAVVVRDIYAAPEGRPSYPPLLMVKVLLLQQWYQASDPEIEAALWDRLSFRRFVGLGLQDPGPDHSTISRFRTALADRGLGECLFAEVTRQLDAAGWLVKAGTLMDATLVAAQARRPSMDEGPGAGSATDPEASWTRKGGRAHFGLQGAPGGRCGVGADPASRADAGARERKRGGGHVDQRRRAGGLRGQGLRVQGSAGAGCGRSGINDRIMHRSHSTSAGCPTGSSGAMR